MHELSIVEAVIEQVQSEVQRSGQPGRVMGLELVIGRLSGVSVDAIRFAFQTLSPGTIVETAELRVSEPKATCCCRACGAATEIEELFAECPQCRSGNVAIQGGRELLLQTIELEDHP